MALKSLVYRLIQNQRRKKLAKYGDEVIIPSNCNFQGTIECGSYVKFGRGGSFVSTRAKIKIHDYIIFGPNVTIYTGDHPMDVMGKHIYEISDDGKQETDKWDKDVVIESGCWIGTRSIILKGVTIGRGSVIGAGVVVTKDVPPYSIYVGVPSARVIPRFTEKEIKEHERSLIIRGISPDSMLGESCNYE